MSDTRKSIEELRAAHRAALDAITAAEESIPKLRENARLAYSEIEQWRRDVAEGDKVEWTTYDSHVRHLGVVSKVQKYNCGKTVFVKPILKGGGLGKEKQLNWSHRLSRVEPPKQQSAEPTTL